MPRGERKTIAAATFVDTKWPDRNPKNLAAIRLFIVGQRAVELAQASEQDILALVRDDLLGFMGVTAEPLFHTFYRWPSSMPQYVVGHGHRIQKIFEYLDDYPGLFLVVTLMMAWEYQIAFGTRARRRNRYAPRASNRHETLVRIFAGRADRYASICTENCRSTFGRRDRRFKRDDERL